MREIRTSGSMSGERKRSGDLAATAPLLDSTHGSGGASQVAEKRFPPGIRCAALECGSLLPLWREPACWRGIALPVEISASKLAGRKAAASCRTPKLRTRKQAVWSKGHGNDHEGLVRAGSALRWLAAPRRRDHCFRYLSYHARRRVSTSTWWARSWKAWCSRG